MTTGDPTYEGSREWFLRQQAARKAKEDQAARDQARRQRVASSTKPTPAVHPAGTPLQHSPVAKPTPVRPHVFNLDRSANPPVSLKKELKEMGLDMVPVYGTYRSAKALADQWKDLSVAQRMSGVALTGVSAAGDVFIVVGALKAAPVVLKLSARTARQSPHLVKRILTEQTGAVRLGSKADDIAVVSASGRSASGGVSNKLRDELGEILRTKGVGPGAKPKTPGVAGYRGPGAPKPATYKTGKPQAQWKPPSALRQALGLPSGQYIVTGTALRTVADLTAGYAKADPQTRERILADLAVETQKGHILKVTEAQAPRVIGQVTTTITGTGVTTKPALREQPKTKTDKVTKTKTGTLTKTKPVTETPKRPHVRVKPSQRTKDTGRPIPLFLVMGRRQPRGKFPRIITWSQGFTQWTMDLDTGKRTPTMRKREWEKSPYRSFRVLKHDKTPPKRRIVEMGVVDILVTPTGIERYRPRGARIRDNTFRRRRL